MAQPPESDDEPALQRRDRVPKRWLASFESTEEARRLARLEADRDLLDTLMWSGYSGPEYERFAELLARYGLAVITAWCRSGVIFTKCAEKGWGVANVVEITDDVADELANLTVAMALIKFRETVLIPNKWDHRKGATLKTYFIGQCLLRFLNVYRSWLRDRRRNPASDSPPLSVHDATAAQPGDGLLAKERRRELLDALTSDPVTREALIYKSEGYSDEEIAELTGLTVEGVKSRLYRLRKKARHVA